MKYIKTTISRKKLYEKNYARDSIEIIEDTDEEVLHSINYKSLIDILTLKYSENKIT
ncbi:MAG: hypothetical protein E7C54_18165 [Clostridioides difficile]|nr:hypothetical protein [Clostridioides difficile]